MRQSISQERLKANTNLRIHTDEFYKGLRVITSRCPLILNYLHKTYDTIEKALNHHPRLLAIRFDLRYPLDLTLPDELMTNLVIKRFVESLSSQIECNRLSALKKNKRVHDTDVRYVWAREFGKEDRPHYHFLLLLNRDAFHTLGYFNSERDNMFNRIVSAWASALRLTDDQCKGLVYIPDNPVYHLDRNVGDAGKAELFYRASYLCKVSTKKYGDGSHAFGCSRI